MALVLLLAITPGTASAEDKYVLQEKTFRVLNEAREKMTAGDNAAALSKLKALLPEVSDNQYDTAVVQQTLGYVYHALDDTDRALSSFMTAADSGKLPPEVTHELHYIIAQLAIYTGANDSGLKYLGLWFADATDPPAEAHLLAASVYLQKENYKAAVPHLQDAIEKTAQAPRNWYEMLLGAYLRSDQLQQAADVLEKMIVRYPEQRDFWLQLIAVYQQLGKDRKSLAISELAHARGLLEGEEIINLVRQYLYLEMPYKAGRLLAQEINQGRLQPNRENLQLLINSWLSAREHDHAIETLQQLVRLESDPEHEFRLAQLLVDRGDWRAALPHLQAVVEASGFGRAGEAWLLLGMCRYELNDKPASLAAFNQALTHDRSREQARWWVQQLSEELEDSPAGS